MNRVRRIRVVSEWAARVLERGPQSSRGLALRVLGKANHLIERYRAQLDIEREDRAAARMNFHVDEVDKVVFEEAMDILARAASPLCLEYLIVAPPGLHHKMMKWPAYRSRLEFMRAY